MNTEHGRVAEATGLSQAEPVARRGPSGFDPSRVQRVARAIAAHKRKLPVNDPAVDRVWSGYCGQARAVLAADDSALAQENSDLVHDLERQMTIANIECNIAEERRDLLEIALPYVASMASAQSMVDGFGEKLARQADVDARAIHIALGFDLPPLEVGELLRPALSDEDFDAIAMEARQGRDGETRLDPKHESAVAKPDAQTAPPNTKDQ